MYDKFESDVDRRECLHAISSNTLCCTHYFEWISHVPTYYFKTVLKRLQISRRKTLFFSRLLREQKSSNANFSGENSARFRVSSRRPFFFVFKRDFAEKLLENSQRNSANFAKFRAGTPRKLEVM